MSIDVALIGGAQDYRKKTGEIRRRRGIRGLYKFIDGADFPCLEDVAGESSFATVIVRPQDSGDGASADPMARPFIRDGEAPSASPRQVSRLITAVGN